MSRFILLILLVTQTARADSPPSWRIYRDHGRLVLLSPTQIVHVDLPRYYVWEGTASTFEAEYRGPASAPDLCLTVHRDLYQTSWWYDCRIVQKPDGEILATWCSTREDSDVTFARYPSFAAAWKDRRFRLALQPALCALNQLLPPLPPQTIPK